MEVRTRPRHQQKVNHVNNAALGIARGNVALCGRAGGEWGVLHNPSWLPQAVRGAMEQNCGRLCGQLTRTTLAAGMPGRAEMKDTPLASIATWRGGGEGERAPKGGRLW